MKQTIDINCDLGEGIGNEAQLMPYISSCNLACGGHAGDEATIEEVVSLAKRYQVGVGAHPAFPDREHFGRKVMDLPLKELKASLLDQINKVATVCQKQNWPMHHIKSHGALYNLCAKDLAYAEMITDLVANNFPKTPVYAPFNSVMAKAARGKIRVLFEAFADRNYDRDGSLVSRSKNNALITDPNLVFEHVFQMVSRGEIRAIAGKILAVKIHTICVHGDTQNAVESVRFLNQKLKDNSIKIQLA